MLNCFVGSLLPEPERWEDDGEPGGIAGTLFIVGSIAVGVVLLVMAVIG